MSTLVIKRIWIDKAECTGHALCVPEAADQIEFTRAGGDSFARIRLLMYTQPELEMLLKASAVCPMRAFRLETEDGRVHVLPDDKAVRAALESGDYRWSDSATGQSADSR